MEPSNLSSTETAADAASRPASDEATSAPLPAHDYELSIDDIVVEGRLRSDMGDIEQLAESIRDNGLLHAVVVELVQDSGGSGGFIKQLRCGGRRFAAFTLLASNKVPSPNPKLYERIPVRIFNEMPSHQRVRIELEENLRRQGLTWQESVEGIVRYHRAARRAAGLDGEKWSQSMTGELLNMSQASVSIAFTVYEAIQNNNEKVIKAESLTEALKVLASENLDQAQAEQMRRINLKRTEAARVQSTQVDPVSRVSSIIVTSANETKPETVNDKVQFTKEQIADFYHEGDAIELLPRLKKAGLKWNHIVCDPPYGIDMSNLVMEGVSRIEDTHKVDDNLQLLPAFLKVAFETIEQDGFLCMWYDLDHHEKIKTWAEDIGWKVQRWPFVWCKSSPCRNSQAQYNITKSTEVCYFLRRSSESILKSKQSNNFLECASCATSQHPFVKPYALWHYLIESVSSPGQIILDPFAGEGSSLSAIFKDGRTPIGIEVDPKHIAGGLSYIQELLNKRSILDDVLTAPPI